MDKPPAKRSIVTIPAQELLDRLERTRQALGAVKRAPDSEAARALKRTSRAKYVFWSATSPRGPKLPSAASNACCERAVPPKRTARLTPNRQRMIACSAFAD